MLLSTHMKDILKALVFGGLFSVLLLPLYVENDFFFPFITGKNFAFRIIVEIVFASWILLALYEPKFRPKFSWIFAGFGALLIVMFFADLLGEYPLKSFWSNFERMDGYVTLVHVFMYVVVLGSVMTTKKIWSWFLHVSVAIALLVAFKGLASHSVRVDSTLGNAAYMAVYMLFNIFFAALLAVQNKSTLYRVGYVLVGLLFTYTLLRTGTRGTFLGLVGGSVAAITYIALFGRSMPQLRRYAVGGMVVLAIAGLSFMAVRDTDFIQNSSALSRIANINLQKDLVVRETIWGMAWQGVKERPLLGWGQGNFNYVFNKHYDPFLYNQEQWFDRVHNIVFDWLIAGGFFGLIAYFFIIFALIYYLFVEPVIFKKDSQFTVTERAVLFGLVVAYVMHNLVVFDNIISYIFFAVLLGLVHSRVASPIKSVEEYRLNPIMISQFVTPVVILITGVVIYFVNIPGIKAAENIIDGLVAPNIPGRLEAFHNALSQESFANQEIVEQLAQQAMNIARDQNIPDADKRNIIQRAELELLHLAELKPGDARVENFISSFYRAIGAIPQAREHAQIAVDLSPRKPSLILEQGIIELQAGDYEAARKFMQKAFELNEKNTQARTFYAVTLVRTGKPEEAKALLESEESLKAFALNDYALSTAQSMDDLSFMKKLFEYRIETQSTNINNYTSLAFIEYELGNADKSVEVLKKAGERIPAFASTSACFIENIQNGVEPSKGCQ